LRNVTLILFTYGEFDSFVSILDNTSISQLSGIVVILGGGVSGAGHCLKLLEIKY